MLTDIKHRVAWGQAGRMCREGGAFESLIAQAWLVADDTNREKLEEAFAEEFAKFPLRK